MKTNRILNFAFAVFILSASAVLQAQNKCGTYEAFKSFYQKNPSILTKFNASLQKAILDANKMERLDLGVTPLTVPVVFHVYKSHPSGSLSDAEVKTILDSLNSDFGEGSKFKAPPARYKSVFQRESFIRFKLASRTPDNKETTGIVKDITAAGKLTVQNAKLVSKGGADAWDVNKYLNIWICDIDRSPDGLGTPPETKDIASVLASVGAQGIVMDYRNYKSGAGCASYKTLTHEVGHYFGLHHNFSDHGDDFVADTPSDPMHNYCCPGIPSAGSGCSVSDDSTMYMNFMDYSCDVCLSMFTKGQVARMLSTLSLGNPRYALLTSNALISPKATTRSFLQDMFLDTEFNANYLSWQVALAMVHSFACSCTPDLSKYLSRTSQVSSSLYSGKSVPDELKRTAIALALGKSEELLMSMNINDLYRRLANGPIALITVDDTNSFFDGIVISGVSFTTAGDSQIIISDPKSIMKSNFNLQYQGFKSASTPSNLVGSQYIVPYERFSLDIMNYASLSNKRLILFSL